MHVPSNTAKYHLQVTRSVIGMKRRQWLPLIGLTLSVFVFNMSEFMPIGLLTGIAGDFGIAESGAGMIVSVYAWAVAVLSLPLMLLLRKTEYKRMLLACVALFAFFQLLSGVSNSYWMLMASRLGVAVAHSIFWSIAAPMAARVVEPGYAKVALGTIAAGTSVAMIVGLPLGRMVGIAFGWRTAFVVIAAISVLVLLLLAAVFPRLENPGTFTARRLPGLFRNRVIAGIYITIAAYVTGYFTMYSYIEPFLLQTADASESTVTVVLTVLGLAGIAGSTLFSRTYDRARFAFMAMSISTSGLCMLALLHVSPWIALLLAVCAAMGMCHTAFTVAVQNELLRASPQDATAVAMSMFSGIFNVGIAMGSIVGGAVADSVSVDYVGTVGFAFVACAAVFASVCLIARIRESEQGAEITPTRCP